jgi:hypothetical protein
MFPDMARLYSLELESLEKGRQLDWRPFYFKSS